MGLHVHLKLTCLLYSEPEVRRCCFLWLVRLSCRCFLVRQLVRLNPGFLSFPTSYLPLFVERTPSSSFPSSSVSRSAVVFFVLVWTQLELGHFGTLVNSFVDSLGWSP